jgi:hypothetical protein
VGRTAAAAPSPSPSPTLPLSSLPSSPQEYVNGQLKNKYGDAFIRGNNGAGGEEGRGWTREPSRADPPHAPPSPPPVLYISTAD